MFTRTLVSKLPPFLAATRPHSRHRFRPIFAAGEAVLRWPVPAFVNGGVIRSFSSRPTTSSPNDPWSYKPPGVTFPGFDLQHWVVVPRMELYSRLRLTRRQLIDTYIKILAQVVGSEQEARMKIYGVSTCRYCNFRAVFSVEIANRINTLLEVRHVFPDAWVDPRKKGFDGKNEGQGGGQTAAYQGGGPAYNGGNQGYQRGCHGHHGDRPHQSDNNRYQARSESGQQWAHHPGNPTNDQSRGYPAGNSPTNYPGGNPPYQARDVHGRY